MLRFVPELRVKARFIIYAHLQASKYLSGKEVIDGLFILTHAHQSLRRALQFNANSSPQSKEKKLCALQIV